MAGLIPAYNRLNVMTGMAALYLQPRVIGTPPELPDVDEALGTVWDAPWKSIGATMEGVTFGFAREATDIRIEEQVTQVDQKTTSVGFTVTVTLSEDTLDTMRLAYGGGEISTVAAGLGTPGTKSLVISSEISHFCLGLEGQAPPRVGLETPRRLILIPDVTSVASVETQYRRATQQRTYNATFTSLVPPEDVVIIEHNAPAT